MGFPKNFVWGVASSSYQVEGAWNRDGKGLSVWDTYVHEPGHIQNQDTGDTACDQYGHIKEDIALMAEMQIKAYRFSISWPRVMPEGTGRINQKGLDYYDRLTDQLLENRITPYITLFHWDLPYQLYTKGGWMNRDITDYFAAYAETVVNRLSDRVKYWITENEPQCYIGAALASGEHAPGLKLGKKELFLAAHHSLLAHGKAAYIPDTTAEDMKIISQPIDFIGMNVYQTYRGKAGENGTCITIPNDPGYARTNAEWPVTPEALYWGPKFYEERYHKKLYITENGLSNQDWIFLDGQVHDLQRIDFLHRYLYQLKRAVEEGISVEGYFHWTLTDNFEWTSGYNNRFGLVYTDFKNQNRIIKDSGKWYRQVIETNGEIIK